MHAGLQAVLAMAPAAEDPMVENEGVACRGKGTRIMTKLARYIAAKQGVETANRVPAPLTLTNVSTSGSEKSRRSVFLQLWILKTFHLPMSPIV
jgi:hypothetical protein